MSYDHKAFAFDWAAFRSGLAPLLHEALAEDDAASLARFIDAHLAQCSNPYDGEPLDASWREAMENGDVKEHGDFALTCYYSPAEDIGLHGEWAQLEESIAPPARDAMLGKPFGPDECRFDPGLQGSYFQTPDDVARNLDVLAAIPDSVVAEWCSQLEKAGARNRGLYVTF